MPSRPEHLWSDPVRPSWTEYGLDEVWSSKETRGLDWHQSSSGSMPLEDVVDSSTSQTHATSNSTLRMSSWASATTSCLMPIGVGRGIIRTISENWEKIYSCWFQLATVRRQIWENDHLSCVFGLRRYHLALEWKSGHGKVGFRLGAVTSVFHVNFSQLEAQKLHPYRFFASNGDVATFFPRVFVAGKVPYVYVLTYWVLLRAACVDNNCGGDYFWL